MELSTHPDDAYARMNEHDNGKTELWYVVEADENAYIYLGPEFTIYMQRKAKIGNDS